MQEEWEVLFENYWADYGTYDSTLEEYTIAKQAFQTGWHKALDLVLTKLQEKDDE